LITQPNYSRLQEIDLSKNTFVKNTNPFINTNPFVDNECLLCGNKTTDEKQNNNGQNDTFNKAIEHEKNTDNVCDNNSDDACTKNVSCKCLHTNTNAKLNKEHNNIRKSRLHEKSQLLSQEKDTKIPTPTGIEIITTKKRQNDNDTEYQRPANQTSQRIIIDQNYNVCMKLFCKYCFLLCCMLSLMVTIIIIVMILTEHININIIIGINSSAYQLNETVGN
jgi:hypothetical protein